MEEVLKITRALKLFFSRVLCGQQTIKRLVILKPQGILFFYEKKKRRKKYFSIQL